MFWFVIHAGWFDTPLPLPLPRPRGAGAVAKPPTPAPPRCCCCCCTVLEYILYSLPYSTYTVCMLRMGINGDAWMVRCFSLFCTSTVSAVLCMEPLMKIFVCSSRTYHATCMHDAKEKNYTVRVPVRTCEPNPGRRDGCCGCGGAATAC